MIKAVLIAASIIACSGANAKDVAFRENINKDSLFESSIANFPEKEKIEYRDMYKKSSANEKDFMLLMISMPVSSKRELVSNYTKHKFEIIKAKEEYSKLVPAKYSVYLEFEPASKILTTPEQITIKIYKIKDDTSSNAPKIIESNSNYDAISQDWELNPDSKELEKIIASIGWTKQTLGEIKNLLNAASCISIENGQVTTIGFARSGMGMYSYKLFDEKITNAQKEKFNNGCEYILYKDIALEYSGGAIGQQCFEKN